MNANKLFLDYLFQFWDENWNKIDRSKYDDDDLPVTLDEFKKQLRSCKYDRYWSLVELATWGMNEDYKPEYPVLKFHDPDCDRSEVPSGYRGVPFLISETNYDAYEVRYTEEIVKYRIYKPVK